MSTMSIQSTAVSSFQAANYVLPDFTLQHNHKLACTRLPTSFRSRTLFHFRLLYSLIFGEGGTPAALFPIYSRHVYVPLSSARFCFQQISTSNSHSSFLTCAFIRLRPPPFIHHHHHHSHFLSFIIDCTRSLSRFTFFFFIVYRVPRSIYSLHFVVLSPSTSSRICSYGQIPSRACGWERAPRWLVGGLGYFLQGKAKWPEGALSFRGTHT